MRAFSTEATVEQITATDKNPKTPITSIELLSKEGKRSTLRLLGCPPHYRSSPALA
jgi:hypothetical protein